MITKKIIVNRALKRIYRKYLEISILKLIKFLNFWRYPADLDPDTYFTKTICRLYWHHKKDNPIINPEKGHNIKEYFTKRRKKIETILTPKGFQKKMSLKMSAVGDLTNSRRLEHSKEKLYSKVKDIIFDVDISIANLEASLCLNPKKYETLEGLEASLCLNPKKYEILKGHKNKKYTIFSIANNHILDFGMDGFATIHNKLDKDGFYYIGTNKTPEDQKKGFIITINGIKIGMISATYSVNEKPFPDNNYYMVNLVPFHKFKGKVNVSLIEEQISYCQSQSCDFILLSLHWGMEFEFFPRQEQIDIAHNLIEYGADMLIGHHCHNIQPYEFYQTNRDPYRKAPIFYNLGNLTTPLQSPYNRLSLIINWDINKGDIEGKEKTLIEGIKVTPVLQVKYNHKNKPYLRIEKLNEYINSVNDKTKNEIEYTISKYADLVLGRSWRNY